MTPPLLPILDHLRAQPSRTWSIVVTFYGDAVAPRGGAVSLAALLAVFAAMGVGGNVVRTAMSRLAGNGWVERTRLGRNSFYRLTAVGRATFTAAAGRIYGTAPAGWDGRLRLVLLDPGGPDRDRAALEQAGFGMAAPGLWVGLNGAVDGPLPDGVPDSAIGMAATAAEADARRLAAQAWPLARLAGAYGRFAGAFGPLDAWVGTARTLSDADALVARTLLVHEYRRIVLRDPGLPVPLLPADWPGLQARALAGRLYRALLPGSERWLDHHAADEAGPIRPADASLAARFQG